MKLSEKDRKLVKQSIKHWNEDIVKPLEEGRKTVRGWGGRPMWKNTSEYLPVSERHCPLCAAYNDKANCIKCPYVKHFNMRCDNGEKNNKGHWTKFLGTPTLLKAKNMVKALEAIEEN